MSIFLKCIKTYQFAGVAKSRLDVGDVLLKGLKLVLVVFTQLRKRVLFLFFNEAL